LIIPDGKDIGFIFYQVQGCKHGLNFGKEVGEKTCFKFSFKDTLKVDFCVYGNCCPDSNRFMSNFNIRSDTIFVTVLDTAAHLCRCICEYINHVEITGLEKEKYVFYSIYDTLIYNEIVIKQR
jgi:hypothetical protein